MAEQQRGSCSWETYLRLNSFEEPVFTHPIDYADDAHGRILGELALEDVSENIAPGATAWRTGQIALQSGQSLDVVLTHSPATAGFMYLHRMPMQTHLFDLLDLPMPESAPADMALPGQVILGAPRTKLVGSAISDAMSSPQIREAIASCTQDEVVILPVLREGAKFQVAEALFDIAGYYCDEAILDSHHVFDPTVPRYHRRVETTILKDQDISPRQREGKRLAIVGDSIASGIVMLGVLGHVGRRFDHIGQIEIVAPFATLRGLARLALYSPPRFRIRVHVFETLLNALPPDYYYSAHYPEAGFHIRPDLEEQYRDWWGTDSDGNAIADTACAGYGWAEAFFNPRKQLQMIDDQLSERHGLTIAEVVQRNITLNLQF